jgi:hypothetical protein
VLDEVLADRRGGLPAFLIFLLRKT